MTQDSERNDIFLEPNNRRKQAIELIKQLIDSEKESLGTLQLLSWRLPDVFRECCNTEMQRRADWIRQLAAIYAEL